MVGGVSKCGALVSLHLLLGPRGFVPGGPGPARARRAHSAQPGPLQREALGARGSEAQQRAAWAYLVSGAAIAGLVLGACHAPALAEEPAKEGAAVQASAQGRIPSKEERLKAFRELAQKEIEDIESGRTKNRGEGPVAEGNPASLQKQMGRKMRAFVKARSAGAE
eukprot:CAMPEP_0179072110 /NCGR_PEP_ID=MMETSP0796-20121207/31884_1 /TAXON_ID=73915 /ORGANISM="Pyrodinium bahamense, Strain pbaha01" /LENGTH=165 /DNA_ID=CAMNT_0020769257 /DNA_START=1 /DNA_END=498 /DNA_ORIENTATION=+